MITIRGSIDWIRPIGNATISDEFIKNAGRKFGAFDLNTDKEIIIRDSLGIEQYILNLSITLSYNITDKFQVNLSYNTDVEGIGVFETKDAADVSTYSLAAGLFF